MSETSAETELQRLKRECAEMMATLQKLEEQELDLQCENKILAREALLSGYDVKIVEPAPPKSRRRAAPANKRKQTPASQN